MPRFQIIEDTADWAFGSKLIDTHTGETLWVDHWQMDCPEDLTLGRRVGVLVDVMNELHAAVEDAQGSNGFDCARAQDLGSIPRDSTYSSASAGK